MKGSSEEWMEERMQDMLFIDADREEQQMLLLSEYSIPIPLGKRLFTWVISLGKSMKRLIFASPKERGLPF